MVDCSHSQTKHRSTSANCGHNDVVDQSVIIKEISENVRAQS